MPQTFEHDFNSLQVDHVLNDHNGRKIAISLIDSKNSEEKAHTCVIACLQQLGDTNYDDWCLRSYDITLTPHRPAGVFSSSHQHNTAAQRATAEPPFVSGHNRPVKVVGPVYPAAAWEAGVEGVVNSQVVVGKD